MTEIRPLQQKSRFPLGDVRLTRAAYESLGLLEIAVALYRHERGDWGDACEEDREANDQSLAEELRLFSVYHDRKGTKFWIITEADRSATTVLFPADY